MLGNIIFKAVPYLFISFFIFFEFTPNYLFDAKLVKPYMFFIVFYCWLISDSKKFSSLSIFIFSILYDLFQGDVVGITSLFFLFMQYTQRKKYNELISNDIKEIWIKFILNFTLYLSIMLILNIFLKNNEIAFKNVAISFIITITLFPLFFSIVDKLSYKFKNYHE